MSTAYSNDEIAALQEKAKRHLWLHFTRMSSYADSDVPVIVRGEGAYVYDQHGKRYLDGLAGLFVSQIGHGRTEVAEAAARQASQLAYFPLWSYAHPQAIALADRLANLAPGDLNRVFFTSLPVLGIVVCSSHPVRLAPRNVSGSGPDRFVQHLTEKKA